MKIFITGSNGFVGQHFKNYCRVNSLEYTAGTQDHYGNLAEPKSEAELQNIRESFKGHSAVVHLANRAHVMGESQCKPNSDTYSKIIKIYNEINVHGTLMLARAARDAGVKKFIFISSIKVNGEENNLNAYCETDPPNPQDPYGISKRDAEIELMKLHTPGVFEITVIRPPLIYGPGVKANFLVLQKISRLPLPLPFLGVKNQRSMIHVKNLIEFILCTINHPRSSGETFLIADENPYSLHQMISELRKCFHVIDWQFYCPTFILRLFFKLLGKDHFNKRLFDNLAIDPQKSKNLLNFSPKYSLKDFSSME